MLIDVNVLNVFFDIFFPDFFRPIKYEYAVYVSMNIFRTLERLLFFFLFIKIDIHK